MLNSGLPLGLARSATTDVLAVVVFATYPVWFYLGTELGLAGHRLATAQRLKERDRIIGELVSTTFPEGGAIPPGAGQVGTAAVVESLLTKIPPIYDDALTLLLFVFDSRFFVLAFTGKWKRFVDLEGGTGLGSEKQKYMDAWQSNPYLLRGGGGPPHHRLLRLLHQAAGVQADRLQRAYDPQTFLPGTTRGREEPSHDNPRSRREPLGHARPPTSAWSAPGLQGRYSPGRWPSGATRSSCSRREATIPGRTSTRRRRT